MSSRENAPAWERALHILSSSIGVGTFAATLFVRDVHTSTPPLFQTPWLLPKALLFLAFGGFLTYGFAALLTRVEHQGDGLPRLGLTLLLLIAAWTYVFLIQWFWTGPIPRVVPVSQTSLGRLVNFIPLFVAPGVVLCLFAAYFFHHMSPYPNGPERWKPLRGC